MLSLVFGGFFASLPTEARAGFLSSISSILGSDAYAGVGTSITNKADSSSINNNSQTMDLLSAETASPAGKSGKTGNKKDGPFSEEGSEVAIADNALLPSATPHQAKNKTKIENGTGGVDYDQISIYVVRSGDSISEIADMFDVSVNTILWANDMKKGEKLVVGDMLFILPVTGVKHVVAKGQTLKGIAKLYKADASLVAEFNGISENEKLAVGDELIIPDGEREPESDKPVKNLTQNLAKDLKYYESSSIKNLAGYFINPVPGYHLSQGLHDGNAVDLAIKSGTPIRAAAEGKVSFAKASYNGGFGYLVIINHPNGTQTYYAHMSKIITTAGAEVAQGETIGYVGSTGRSTGPHVHFVVKGARNPGIDNSWKY